MMLIIKSFLQILMKDYKLHGKRTCFKYGKIRHFSAIIPYANDDDIEEGKKGNKKVEKKKFFKKGGEAHIGKEWDSNESSSNFDNEGVATLAKRSLFPKFNHACLLVKERKMKVYTRDSPNYTSSIDDDYSSDEKDMNLFFQGT